MPKLKDADGFKAIGPKKQEKPKEEKPKAPEKSVVKDQIARILGRHKVLPTELVEKFYACQNKCQVKRVLRDWLRAQTPTA